MLEDLRGIGRTTLELEMHVDQPVLRYRVRFRNLGSSTVYLNAWDMLPWIFDDNDRSIRTLRVNQWVNYGKDGNFEPLTATLAKGCSREEQRGDAAADTVDDPLFQLRRHSYGRVGTHPGRGAERERGRRLRSSQHGAEPGQIVFTVTDRGPGIPESDVESVFDIYTSKKDGDTRGVGLGLPLSRRLARLLGGDLRALVRQGGGGEFVLELPASPGS